MRLSVICASIESDMCDESLPHLRLFVELARVVNILGVDATAITRTTEPLLKKPFVV